MLVRKDVGVPRRASAPGRGVLICVHTRGRGALRHERIYVGSVTDICYGCSHCRKRVGKVVISGVHNGGDIVSMVGVVRRVARVCSSTRIVDVNRPRMLMRCSSGDGGGVLRTLGITTIYVLVFFNSTFAVVTFGGSVSVSNIFRRFCGRVVNISGPRISILRIFCYVNLTIKVVLFFGRVKGHGLSSSIAPVRIRVSGRGGSA